MTSKSHDYFSIHNTFTECKQNKVTAEVTRPT